MQIHCFALGPNINSVYSYEVDIAQV